MADKKEKLILPSVAPRGKQVNDVLRSKRNTKHYSPKTDFKRAAEKDGSRRTVTRELSEEVRPFGMTPGKPVKFAQQWSGTLITFNERLGREQKIEWRVLARDKEEVMAKLAMRYPDAQDIQFWEQENK